MEDKTWQVAPAESKEHRAVLELRKIAAAADHFQFSPEFAPAVADGQLMVRGSVAEVSNYLLLFARGVNGLIHTSPDRLIHNGQVQRINPEDTLPEAGITQDPFTWNVVSAHQLTEPYHEAAFHQGDMDRVAYENREARAYLGHEYGLREIHIRIQERKPGDEQFGAIIQPGPDLRSAERDKTRDAIASLNAWIMGRVSANQGMFVNRRDSSFR